MLNTTNPGGMIAAPTFCTCPPREGAGVRTEPYEHLRTCPIRHSLKEASAKV